MRQILETIINVFRDAFNEFLDECRFVNNGLNEIMGCD